MDMDKCVMISLCHLSQITDLDLDHLALHDLAQVELRMTLAMLIKLTTGTRHDMCQTKLLSGR